MEILGIGFGELLLIVLIILILFGPKEMVKTGKTLGQWLNQLVRSPTYKALTKTGEELKNLPRNLMREANLEGFQDEIRQIGKDVHGQAKSIGGAFANSFDRKQVFSELDAATQAKQQEEPPEPPRNEKPNRISTPELPRDDRD
ncbi:MAG: twin-arginine translocase TatA/TatE family subunit [Anaerolineales bacterium]